MEASDLEKIEVIDITSENSSKWLFFFKKKVQTTLVHLGKTTAIVTLKEDKREKYHSYRNYDNGEMLFTFKGVLTYIMGELHVYPTAEDQFKAWRNDMAPGTIHLGDGLYVPLDHIERLVVKHENNPVIVKWHK